MSVNSVLTSKGGISECRLQTLRYFENSTDSLKPKLQPKIRNYPPPETSKLYLFCSTVKMALETDSALEAKLTQFDLYVVNSTKGDQYRSDRRCIPSING
jgi:hypothetical protein